MINANIAAEVRPWFFIYRYSSLMSNYKRYEKAVRSNCKIRFLKDMDEIIKNPKTDEEKEFLYYYYKYMPVNKSPGTMNRICWEIEKEFENCDVLPNVKFDYSVLKRNNIEYDKEDYEKIEKLYSDYTKLMHLFSNNRKQNDSKKEERTAFMDQIVTSFKKACYSVCSDNYVLANILVDVCYKSENSKAFAWEIAGGYIYKNILYNCGGIINYPTEDKNGDILFMGNRYSLKAKEIEGGFYDDI